MVMKRIVVIAAMMAVVMAAGVLPSYGAAVTRARERGQGIVGGSLGSVQAGMSSAPNVPTALQIGAIFRYLFTDILGIQGELSYASTGEYEHSTPAGTTKWSSSIISVDTSFVVKSSYFFVGGGLGFGKIENDADTSGIRLVTLFGIEFPVSQQVSLGGQMKGAYGITGDASAGGTTWDTDLGGFESKVYVGYTF